MENTEDVDVSVAFYEVGNPVMPIEQYSDIARGRKIALSDLRKIRKHLRPLVDTLNRSARSARIVRCDVLKNVSEPTLRFLGSLYFCHDRIRCAISSFEIVRFASESASPRSTMT